MDPAQELARRFTVIHNLAYYCPEIRDFAAAGISGWWNAYFVYRSAPMGQVTAPVAVAAFYNFAPRMIGKALPQAWSVMSPQQAIDLRGDCVDRALRRIFGDPAQLDTAAQLARRAIDGADPAGRHLYAGETSLPWSTEPHVVLWQACTLLREHRGDSHNIALAAAQVDGVECHVLMAGRGHGNKASILPIRGWTEQEWDAAAARLHDRGWANEDGSLTDEGRDARREIEAHTNRLTAEPVRRLGTDGVAELCELLDPVVAALHQRGDVPGTWPPPHLQRPDV